MYSRNRPVVGQRHSSQRSMVRKPYTPSQAGQLRTTELGSTTVIKNGNSIIE